AAVTERPDIHHVGLGKNAGPAFFGEVEIAKVERVFCAIAATDHAAAAADAGGSRGTFASKERIRKGLVSGLSVRSLKNAHIGAVESMANARGIGRLLQQAIGRSEDFVLD